MPLVIMPKLGEEVWHSERENVLLEKGPSSSLAHDVTLAGSHYKCIVTVEIFRC